MWNRLRVVGSLDGVCGHAGGDYFPAEGIASLRTRLCRPGGTVQFELPPKYKKESLCMTDGGHTHASLTHPSHSSKVNFLRDQTPSIPFI